MLSISGIRVSKLDSLIGPFGFLQQRLVTHIDDSVYNRLNWNLFNKEIRLCREARLLGMDAMAQLPEKEV
jgi:hypothetical protein